MYYRKLVQCGLLSLYSFKEHVADIVYGVSETNPALVM